LFPLVGTITSVKISLTASDAFTFSQLEMRLSLEKAFSADYPPTSHNY